MGAVKAPYHLCQPSKFGNIPFCFDEIHLANFESFTKVAKAIRGVKCASKNMKMIFPFR